MREIGVYGLRLELPLEKQARFYGDAKKTVSFECVIEKKKGFRSEKEKK